jgi:RNA methyltransferase, TrmH family
VLGEALDSGAIVEAVFVEVGWAHEVLTRLSASVSQYALDTQTLERVADTTSPQGVLAVLRREVVDVESLRRALSDGGFVVVASALQDPGNCGTIIRSAEGAGACGVVLCDQSVDPTSPKTLRSTAGAFFHVPVVEYGPIGDLVVEFQAWGVRCFATSSVLQGGSAPDAMDLTGPLAIIVGNEAKGLDPAILGRANGLLTIPTVGRTESLNVAMSATLIAFEAARQRRSRP